VATNPNQSTIRVTRQSSVSYAETRERLETRAPALDPAVTFDLVVRSAEWREVEAAIQSTVGPDGFVSFSRLDQGALLSLAGSALEATQYLLGNPLIARRILERQPGAALNVPLPLAVFSDSVASYVSYLLPSSMLASFGSTEIDEIGSELDLKLEALCDACVA
jgi:uncharacterized protein (DUF302 family)